MLTMRTTGIENTTHNMNSTVRSRKIRRTYRTPVNKEFRRRVVRVALEFSDVDVEGVITELRGQRQIHCVNWMHMGRVRVVAVRMRMGRARRFNADILRRQERFWGEPDGAQELGKPSTR